jgi:PAS domain-containing protein
LSRASGGLARLCNIDTNAIEPENACARRNAEQSVDELLEALRANNQALQATKEAEEAARARLSSLLGAAPVVVYSFRASGDFAPTFVSDSIQGMLGYRTDEYLRMRISGGHACIPKTLLGSKASRANCSKADGIRSNTGSARRMVPIAG